MDCRPKINIIPKLGHYRLACWVAAQLAMSYFRGLNYASPGFSSLVLRPSAWFFFAPIPWGIYSLFLSARRELSARAAFIFAGTIGFAMTAVFCSVVVAGLLPLLPLKSGH
jgi:hypothetical protein